MHLVFRPIVATLVYRSSLLTPAHPGGPGKRAVKRVIPVLRVSHELSCTVGHKDHRDSMGKVCQSVASQSNNFNSA